ncbi:MAG TPA: hypothetical protein VFO44_11460 [Steroidobacteraceae bacterium]|nr:hypothetical protein [Steroidobacteraceae bacterium]
MGEEGEPNGVAASRTSVTRSSSIWYRPVPPMMPIIEKLPIQCLCQWHHGPRHGKMPENRRKMPQPLPHNKSKDGIQVNTSKYGHRPAR